MKFAVGCNVNSSLDFSLPFYPSTFLLSPMASMRKTGFSTLPHEVLHICQSDTLWLAHQLTQLFVEIPELESLREEYDRDDTLEELACDHAFSTRHLRTSRIEHY
jgi:hypothetical protein